MTPVVCFEGKRVALVGLGGSGFATARALNAGGAHVTAWDDGALARARALNAGIDVEDLERVDFSRFDALVLSPGVPLTHPKPHWSVQKARAAGVEIIGDVELFCRERARIAPEAPFIAITGTNGKSTTTALTAHILREAGVDVQLGGNIGTPILDLEPPSNERVHVIEVSSFQIDLAPSLAPTAGALINLTPDHIDRHGSMENYAAVKARLVNGARIALVGVDDEASWRIGQQRMAAVADEPARATCPVSARRTLARGVFVQDGQVISTFHDESGETLATLDGIGSLRGAHNAQNAAFAAGLVHLWQFPPRVIDAGMRSFPGLPHRMEEVGRAGPVMFVNDSKATNADAAEKALLSFDDIYWIAGGRAKEGGVKPLLPLMSRVRGAYLIGESTDDFARTLDGATRVERCDTLDKAIARAAQDARRDGRAQPVVLLSPACASYDQFANYEARGDAFRDLARALIDTSKD